MKKILLTMVMVLMMASPVMAGTPTIINGVGRNIETVNVDNKLYLPLRTIAEVLGLDVQWDGTFVRIDSAKRPTITGDDKFKGMVNQALDLLQAKDPVDYEMVCRNTKEIVYTSSNSNKNGEAYATSLGLGRFEVSQLLFDKQNLSMAFLASVLVHEATHLSSERNFITSRKESENISYLHQIATLTILGASSTEIDDAERTRQWAIANAK